MIKLFYQKDPLWKNIKIPGTNLTIGNAGCCICNLASLACYYGKNENPATITSKLKYINGLVIWKSITDIYPDIKFIKLTSCIGKIHDSLELGEYIKNGNPVIVKVKSNIGQHFVLIYSKKNNNYLMLDPGLNFNGNFERYYSKIYGIVFFKGPRQQGQAQQTTQTAQSTQTQLNINTSIVDYLKYRGLDSSFEARAKLYQKIFGKKYLGTAQQNTEFLAYAKKNL